MCATVWRQSLDDGAVQSLDGFDAQSGFITAATTSAGIHALAGNDWLTFDATAEGLGGLRPDETAVIDFNLTSHATSWGYVARHTGTNTAVAASRADAAAGFADLGLSDVVAVGVSRDGARAVFGTGSGEVFLLTEDAPATPVSLGSPDAWPFGVADLTQTWMLITEGGLVVWLVQSGNPVLYLYPLDG